MHRLAFNTLFNLIVIFFALIACDPNIQTLQPSNSTKLILRHNFFHEDSVLMTSIHENPPESEIDENARNKFSVLCPSNPFDMILMRYSCLFQSILSEQNDSDIKIEKFTTLNKYKEEKLSIIAQNQNNENLGQKESTNSYLPKKRKPRTKNRINYASVECGAKIIETNPEAFNPYVVLTKSKDGYMLNPCNSQRKWIIVELCEEIGIQDIQIANYEYFSSLFKDIQILGSNQFPTKYWDLIGNYSAKNERSLQSFEVTEDPIWYKFIKIRFLTHWGQEFYCPISEIRVYGLPIVEKLNAQLDEDTAYIHRLEKIIDPESTKKEESPTKMDVESFRFEENNVINLIFDQQSDERILQTQIKEFLKEDQHNDIQILVPNIESLDDEDEDEIKKEEINIPTNKKSSDILSVTKVFEKVVEKIKSVETKQSLYSGYLKNITLFYYQELLNLNEFFSKRYNTTNKEIKEFKQTFSSLSSNTNETHKMISRLESELNDIRALMEDRHTFFIIQTISTSIILSVILCFSIVYFIIRLNIIPAIKSKSLLVLNRRNMNNVLKMNAVNNHANHSKKKKGSIAQLKRSVSF